MAITATTALASVGAAALIAVLPRILTFVWIYFLRPSSIGSYLHGDAPYALVTGASDGIGAAVAHELYDRGFNLILHGRNEEKLRKVGEEIRARGGASKDMQYFIAEATNPDTDFAALLAKFKGLNITIVVNNVGYGSMKHARIDGLSEDFVLGVVHLNALFALRLTRVLLPQLRVAVGPALVIFIGSYASGAGIPRLPLYSASKAFLGALAHGLSADEHYWDRTNVSFMHAVVGEVSTNSLQKPVSLTCPSASQFAQALVARVGCGKVRISPWLPHAVLQWVVGFFPEQVLESMTASVMLPLVNAADKKSD